MTFVVGTVRDEATGRALPGVMVRLSWEARGPAGAGRIGGETVAEEAPTDDRGRYRFFDIPPDSPLTARAFHGDASGLPVTFYGVPAGIRCQELTMPVPVPARSSRERTAR